ncbi:MAG: hypothetical protein AAF384_19550, partial [Pseudomonadota bacterium]
FSYDWAWIHYLVFVINIVFMAWAEGYKGFQKAYSPRLVSRCEYLCRAEVSLKTVLLAPLFCMGFYGAPRRRVIVAYALTLMIIGFVIVFRSLPQPWRGVLDGGVVVGLTWGVTATVYEAVRVFLLSRTPADPEVLGDWSAGAV